MNARRERQGQGEHQRVFEARVLARFRRIRKLLDEWLEIRFDLDRALESNAQDRDRVPRIIATALAMAARRPRAEGEE